MAVPLGVGVDLLAVAAQPGLQRPAIVSVRGWQLLVADPLAELDTLERLDRYAEAVGWRGPAPEGPPFRGGAVGLLTEDLSAGLLSLTPDPRPAAVQLPSLRFTVHDWALAVAPDGQGWAVGTPDRIADLRQVAAVSRPEPAPAPAPARAAAGMGRAQHADAVARILEWIAAGDLYQANLTLQVRAAWRDGGVALARALWSASPRAAHAAMIAVDDDTTVVSISPETFLRTTGDTVTTRPIKGTRPRATDAARDAAAGAALRSSAKDHAEHVMIVDLERNDLGRVCEPGSVRVPAYAALEGHPTVWHLTSTVTGTLRRHVGLGELLAATFPSGSVTGTPKRMAVERTRLVEPVRRGVYCGAIGLVGPGVVDLSVAIRTAVLRDGVASYGTGGGIVADSQPADEYAEALAKAAAFLTATNATLA